MPIPLLEDRPPRRHSSQSGTQSVLGDERSIEQGWRLRQEALCHIDLGEHEVAKGGLRAALEMYREAEVPGQIATTSAYLGDVLVAEGRGDEAVTIYREGLARVEDLGG